MPAPARSSPPPGQHGERGEPRGQPAGDARLTRRLAVAALAAAAVAVPVGVLLFLVRSGWRPARALDEDTDNRLHQAAPAWPALAETLRVTSLVTHPWVVRCVACGVAVAAWRQKRRRLAAWVMATGGLLDGLLKLLVHRARPVQQEPVASAGGYWFPSGHAVSSMLLTATLLVLAAPALRGRRRAGAWLAALGFVVLVGFDRVVLGVHYVSDVLAGRFVALAVVTFMVLAFAEWRREERLPPSSPTRGLDPAPRVTKPGSRP